MPFQTISSLQKECLSGRAALALAGALLCSSAEAHSWYPKDCCDDADCAPVERISQFVSPWGGSPQRLVTSRHGTAVLEENFPVRKSHDARMHVCMRHSETDPFGDIGIVCFFTPPSM